MLATLPPVRLPLENNTTASPGSHTTPTLEPRTGIRPDLRILRGTTSSRPPTVTTPHMLSTVSAKSPPLAHPSIRRTPHSKGSPSVSKPQPASRTRGFTHHGRGEG
ncbi:hypothetical protein GCM10023336_34780 [Streptomyces similanensis]|uniref:Uncharacterized protein n=1 Tax=Streptomyces similanensis TaxID=1274988 RepID=A0ABP9KHT0_9ACTN